ncbi:MAG: hypothetical protein J7M40_12670 [Planctomycetes bacterium]|nr:hypothetical protein [Planctomycetota bacterium]
MAQALQNIEISALHFASQLLVPGGIVVVLAGLCIWLGGLRWLKFLAAGMGAMAGLIGACIFSDGSATPIIAAALIAGGIGCFVNKPVVIFSGAAFAAVAALVILTMPAIVAAGDLKPPAHRMPYGEDGQRKMLTVSESVVELKGELLFWTSTIASSVKQSSVATPAIACVAAVIVIGTGCAMPRFVAAITCASLGAVLIFVGMILVLLYKGARPLTGMYQMPAFFGIVVVAMVAFGACVQLLLCPGRTKKPQGESETSGGK